MLVIPTKINDILAKLRSEDFGDTLRLSEGGLSSSVFKASVSQPKGIDHTSIEVEWRSESSIENGPDQRVDQGIDQRIDQKIDQGIEHGIDQRID